MSKHHYLPQFYLKGFTNADGLFMIYLVKEERFKQNGRSYTPASHFFLPNDNTIIAEDQADESIEEHYSRMETRYARILEKIKAVDQGFGLDDGEPLLLNYFAAELYWRVPSQRSMIATVNNVKALNRLGMAVIDKKTLRPVDPLSFDARLKDDHVYQKMLRTILPATTYWNLLDCTWPCTVKTFPDPFPAICSDNPVILRHPHRADVFLDDLIFPLAPNKVLFRIKDMREVFAPNIKCYIDMLLLVQAKEYVCCVDEGYVQHLRAVFEHNFTTAAELRKFIFNHLTKVDS